MALTEEERPPNVRGVVSFSIGVAVVAAIVAATSARVGALGAADVAWPLLAAACVATEQFLVHFEHRRESHAISFSAVPLVVGLYTLPPAELFAAVMLAAVVSLGLIRRQSPIKLGLNLSASLLEVSVAAAVFHALAGDPLSLQTWAAAFAAAVVSGLAQAGVVTTAISIFRRRVEVEPAALVLSGVVSVANTATAIVAVTLLAASPAALVLLALLLPVLFVSYRAHADLREKHRNLGQLYDFSRQISAAVPRGDVVSTLLDALQELMHADSAWLIVPTADGCAVRVRSAGDGGVESITVPPGAPDRVLHDGAHAAGAPDLVDTTLVAPVMSDGEALGTIVVADRSGDVRSFDSSDLRLFTTLVTHAGASLENSHLLDRLREQAAESEHRALHDALTGLPNRTLFAKRMTALLAADRPLAVLLLDLDRFKEVNDTLGHHNGDLLLQEVAHRFETVLRHGDLVARLGGDEFAILLPDAASVDAAVAVARSVLTVLERPVTVSDVTISVSASIGVAVSPEHGCDPTVLLQRADVAMYAAKEHRGDVAAYEPLRDIYSPDRLALAAELRRAIERGELDVHYQPQIDLASGEVTGVEALVRWFDDGGPRMAPDELVSLAENTGLIGSLTRLVLRRAVDECARWRDDGRDIRMSVNLAPRTLLDDELPEFIRTTLRAFDVPARSLCLELTETTIMADQERTIAVLDRLRAIGITIAIDDFGVGYSSLAYLARLPVGEIKIDKSFVMHMATVASDALIVRSVVDLAANLGIPVVAEGVETAAARKALADLGCRTGQGYLFSRPLSSDDLARWMPAATFALTDR